MSTSSSSLSAGLQALVNDGLLPANVTSQQLQNASPGQLTQVEINSVESNTVSSLFAAGGSASEDSVSLSGATDSNGGTTNSLLQALETAVTGSNNSAATSATTGLSTDASSANAGSDTIGTLFSYLG
jgi:hypothetical protein